MEQLLSWIEEFYRNNEALTIALVGALAGSILTLFVVFIRQIVGALRTVLVFVGKKIGGRFAYKSFLDSYLNWMVVEHQDLNLTGIIGSGQKPKLEQVFISLSLRGGVESPHEKLHRDLAKTLNRIGSFFRRKRIEEPEEQVSQAIVFYQQRRLHKIKNLIERSEALVIILVLISILVLIVGFFILVPAYVLFLNTNLSDWVVGPTGSILGLAVSLLTVGFLASLKQEKDIRGILVALTGIPLILYVSCGVLIAYLVGMPLHRAIAALAGMAVPMIGIFVWRWSALRRIQTDNKFAKQMGKLLTRYDNIAVLGKPGAGKSTLVQFIALAFARERAGDRKLRRQSIVGRKLGVGKWYIPILIPLRKVSKTLLERDADGGANLLLETWRDRVLPSDIRADFPDKFFLKMLKKKRCIFLLDGLDEVANEEEFRTVLREIRGFSSRYAGNKFILTSRFSGWKGGTGSSFQELEIDDLVDEQINHFIDDWYKAIEENRVLGGLEAETQAEKEQRLRKAQARAEDLKRALREVESIHRLAENPLLLSIICFVHYHKTLPKERLSLYQDCSNLLLLQWDREKGLPVDDTDLTLRQKEAIMQEIAFAMHTESIGQEFAGKEATGAEILPIIERKLKQFRLPVENARPLFQKLVDRSGVIVAVERYADRFSFSHLTFQEFYTARYIYENQLDTLTHLMDDSIAKLATWWKEVLLLYVSMVKDSSELIHRFCKPNFVNLDDLAGRRVQIAAQCLLQAVAVQDEAIEQMILQHLLNIRLGSGNSISIDSPCSKELRTYLLRFASTPSFPKHALQFAIKELENFRIDSLVTRLLQLAKSADSDIAAASLEILRELAETHDVKEALDLDDMIGLFDHPSEKVKEEALRLICTQDDLLAKRVLLEKIIPFAFKDTWVELTAEEVYLSQRYGHSMSPEQFERISPDAYVAVTGIKEATIPLAKALPRIRYENRSDKQWVRESLWMYFLKARKYRAFGTLLNPFSASAADYQTAIVTALVFLGEKEKERSSHISELLNMLQTGSAYDQLLAIKALSLLQEMGIIELVDTLIQALKSPYSEIRSTALEVLKNSDLGHKQRDEVVSILETGLRSFSLLRKAWLYVVQVSIGSGRIGFDFDEKLSIVQALAKLGARDPRELEALVVLNLVDERDEHQVEMTIRTLAFKLGDDTIDSQVADKLMQNYRNLAVRYRGKRLSSYHVLADLAKLTMRFDQANKGRLIKLLLEEAERMDIDPLRLRLLRDLGNLEDTVGALSEKTCTWILTSLQHRDWIIANMAFEVAVQYRLIGEPISPKG